MREKLIPLSVWARQQGISESLARLRVREGAVSAVRLGRYWYVREVVEEPKGPGQVFTLFTHAGGAGKTSLARDLGFELASRGRKVLLVDADPQANLTAWWGVYEVDERETLLTLLENEGQLSPRTVAPNLDLIPAHVELARAELLLVHQAAHQPDMPLRLRYALDGLREAYDLILVDSLPSLGPLAAAAALAGDGLLVPVELSLKGLQALPTVFAVAARYGETLRRMRLWSGASFVRGVVPNGLERTVTNRAILERLGELAAGVPVSPPLVRRPAVYARAQEEGTAVQAVGGEEVAREYRALGDWFLAEVLQPMSEVKGEVVR